MSHLVKKDSFELVEGLEKPTTLADGTDLNDVIESGVYILPPSPPYDGGGIKNVPMKSIGTAMAQVVYDNSILLVAGNETAITQVMIIPNDVDPVIIAMAVRSKTGSNSWGSWRLVKAGL